MKRDLFSNRIGFILAASGSAVGLGNIWKYPFETARGGGAIFVIMYLFFCFLLCYPIMISEIAIGRKTNKNTITAFETLGSKKWRIIGILGLICGLLILSFYHVVAGWSLGYLIEMIQGNFEIGNNFGGFVSDAKSNLIYVLIFSILTAYFVSKGVSSGIEKLSKILMPCLFILLIVMIIYSFTLPYAWEGIKFYLLPDFSKITVSTIEGALRQCFFSLSLGMGAMITYGSYLPEKENVISSAYIITITGSGVGLLAGFMIFPLVAYQNQGNMELMKDMAGGPGLIFITLPFVFKSFGPILGSIIGSTFFLLLCIAALTSTVSLLEVPVSYLIDKYQMRRNRVVIFVSIFIFLLGIPSILANGASDFFTNSFVLPNGNKDFLSLVSVLADSLLLLGGALIVIFVVFVWKKENLHKELVIGNENYDKSFIKKMVNIFIIYICPVVLSFLFLLVFFYNFIGIKLI